MAKIVALALLCAIAACAPTRPEVADAAATPGNPSLGLRYAQQNCAGCHAIAPGETWSPLPEATSFDTIANTPGMTHVALSAWLQTSHPSMPNLIVERDRVDDLAAYMETLKR